MGPRAEGDKPCDSPGSCVCVSAVLSGAGKVEQVEVQAWGPRVGASGWRREGELSLTSGAPQPLFPVQEKVIPKETGISVGN